MRKEDYDKIKFGKRFENLGIKISESELDRMYRKHLEEKKAIAPDEMEVNEAAFQRAMSNEIQMGYGLAVGGIEPSPEPSPSSPCIEFVNNTADSDFCEIEITTSAPTTFTINWGDGTEFSDVADGTYTLDHTYPDLETDYSCTLCFDDPSLVTGLTFFGS